MARGDQSRQKKLLYRRRHLKWLLNKYTERQDILEEELKNNKQKIEDLWKEFNDIKLENKDG